MYRNSYIYKGLKTMTKTVNFGCGATSPTEEGYVANVANGKGYLDLKVFMNAKGTALRIENRKGTSRVFISLNQVASLKAALDHVLAKRVKTSTKSVTYNKAA
jgi:hypothetical protein